jgi:hypothetical protein
LGGSIGPKSTKCYLKEDVLHLDPTNYVCQLTVTQTPDVPSGGSFTVKTRTCISWCGQGQVRVLVTVLVDFTKSSWLKSTIEKASIDGQQNFYKSLDAAVRKYLDQHATVDEKTMTKKKGKRNRHHKNRHQEKEIENASIPSTSQLTAICMAMMVITNIYIASKMAGVDKQLNQIHRYPGQHHQHAHVSSFDELENSSLWKLLSKLDPDARKEDLKFIQQTRQPVPVSDSSTVNNENDDDVFDDKKNIKSLF